MLKYFIAKKWPFAQLIAVSVPRYEAITLFEFATLRFVKLNGITYTKIELVTIHCFQRLV